MSKPTHAERAALARVGAAVRRRLEGDPAVHRVAAESVEMFALGGFLSADECTRLIELIDRVAHPSSTYSTGAEGGRSSYSGDVDPADPFVRMIERRICDLLGIALEWGETVQGQRYAPGQEFLPHHDWFTYDAPWWPAEHARGGQRSWTVMAYLNDVTEGGVTHFDRIGVSVQPQAGALLVWNNMLSDGSPNPDVRHAALPVVRGVKYVITKWFRARPWN
jgi:prolyl 4-hydroxylase